MSGAFAQVPAPARLLERSGPHVDNVRLGILSMLAGIALMAVMNALSKVLADGYPLAEVTFFRNLFGLAPAVAMIAAAGGRSALHTANLRGHIGRAVVGLISMVLLFWSYRLMPLADAVAISYSAPLFLTALSVPLLGERVGPYRWGAVAVGFVGVLVIVQPGEGALSHSAPVAIAAAVAYALAQITLRQLGRTEAPVTTVFYFTAFATALCALALPFAWVTPSLADFGLMALMGLAGGGSQYFITRAYALAPGAVVSPFSYSGILWATLFGWMLWGDTPAAHVVVGALVLIASGLLILIRETRRRR